MSSPIEDGGRVELLTDPDDLGALADDWRALAEALGNPFVTPEWFRASIRHGGTEPAVIAVRRPDGSLLGLLPLVRSKAGRRGRMSFAGAGLADHLEPVCGPGDREALASAAAAALDLKQLRCATCVLDNVDSEPAWWDAIVDDAPGTLMAKRVKGSVLPYARISGTSWDRYLRGKSRNFRREIRRRADRLERSHRVEYRRTMEAGELADDLAALYRLHDARWSGGSSTSAGEGTRALLSDFAAMSLEHGWLRLWFLVLDDVPVAALLQWLVGSRLNSYYTGFEPRLQREGVGFLLHAHTFRAAIEEGAAEFNMLLGDEPWKGRFSTGRREVSTVVLVRSRHPARILVSGEAAARRALERLPPAVQRLARSLAWPARSLLPAARRR